MPHVARAAARPPAYPPHHETHAERKTGKERGHPHLPTFLVQFGQFFLVLHPQLGHFLELAVTPRTIVSGTDSPNQAGKEKCAKERRGKKSDPKLPQPGSQTMNSRTSTMNTPTQPTRRASVPGQV